MVVCHCLAVGDRAILAEIEAGVIDAEELAARCGAGTKCGSCVPVVEAILATAEASVGIRSAAAVT